MRELLAIAAAVLILPILAFSQATGNNPIYDIIPTINCNGASEKILWNASTQKFTCGADQTLTLATSTATSASDSNNKTLTAWCPSGYKATAGGGEITAGNAAGLVINQSFPTATTSGWTVIYQEAASVTGNWTARAHVVCTR